MALRKMGKLFRSRLVVAIDVLLDIARKPLQKNKSQGALLYGDHQFSFDDDTPITHLKMSHAPSATLCFKMPNIPCFNPSEGGDYEIDEKAEQFIARFHEEIRRQRHGTDRNEIYTSQ